MTTILEANKQRPLFEAINSQREDNRFLEVTQPEHYYVLVNGENPTL